MIIFKQQHPSDLISRLFILEYLREVGAKVLYNKANKYQKEKMFYKFSSEDSEEESIDINYEYCTFIATLHELESFMKLFLQEITEIELKRAKIYEATAKQKIDDEVSAPVDINIMDLANTEIKKNNSNALIY